MASQSIQLSATPLCAKTLFDKIWEYHCVKTLPDGTAILYIDRHMVHEVTSPQAFEGLRMAGRGVRRVDKTLATPDHNVPTLYRNQGISEENSRIQVDTLRKNTQQFGVRLFDMNDPRQGIVHVVGPEQGFSLPGMTLVCGDSHTSTHGAFGALAFGIGTSEVEHVMATQTILQKPAKNMRITVDGPLRKGITAKDIILTIIGKIGTGGGTGCVIEYAGTAIQSLSMEARMTVCNMSIEAGAKAGLIAPDQTTFDYIKGRPMAPKGDMFDQAVTHWKTLYTDDGAVFDKQVYIHTDDIDLMTTWGTSPEDTIPISGTVPHPDDAPNEDKKIHMIRALKYMGLQSGMPISDIALDKIFIGSCTNARIEDLRNVAKVVIGRKVADTVHAIVVPGSGLVKRQAEAEGIDKVLINAGFDWRDAGCSMCLAMNADRLQPGERCASTSNRNFEGRQGRGGRTHLVSPAVAAASAITGRITDYRKLVDGEL